MAPGMLEDRQPEQRGEDPLQTPSDIGVCQAGVVLSERISITENGNNRSRLMSQEPTELQLVSSSMVLATNENPDITIFELEQSGLRTNLNLGDVPIGSRPVSSQASGPSWPSPTISIQSWTILTAGQNFWDLTDNDWRYLVKETKIVQCCNAACFSLPNRQAFSRYLFCYAKNFHEHLPFLHLPTVQVQQMSLELVLAIAAVGSIYCYESSDSMMLFKASRDIINGRAHKEKHNAFGSVRSRFETKSRLREKNDSQILKEALQTTQASVLLVAMATWSAPSLTLREVLEARATLVTSIRVSGLLEYQSIPATHWEQWIFNEGIRRTVLLAFGLLTFHTIIHNDPPAIAYRELDCVLPCHENEWRCTTAGGWMSVHSCCRPQPKFNTVLSELLGGTLDGERAPHSSLGNYVLILALMQHIFFLRQLSAGEDFWERQTTSLVRALEMWQYQWALSPESSLDPQDPMGPVAFTSTALLRVAYIRLSLDIGPSRILGHVDPTEVARAMGEAGQPQRSDVTTCAAYHSVQALAILVRFGSTAPKRGFSWSVQHAVCTTECVVLLTKWLCEITRSYPDLHLSREETLVLNLVIELLKDSNSPTASSYNNSLDAPADLCTGVTTLVSDVFAGDNVWDIVTRTGRALKEYKGTLEQFCSRSHHRWSFGVQNT